MVDEVFKYIKQNTNYSVFFQSNKIDLSRKVKLNLVQSSTDNLLQQTFKGTNLSYKYVDDYIVSYEWRPILPDDSELSFSNVALNFTKPKGKVLELYVNAQDYLDKIANAENSTDVTLLSSISAGTQYFIDCNVQYDCDDFLEIAEKEPSPSFWQAPLAWLAYKFWGVVLVIFNAIGLTGAVIYAKKQKAKSKLKNKLKDLK